MFREVPEGQMGRLVTWEDFRVRVRCGNPASCRPPVWLPTVSTRAWRWRGPRDAALRYRYPRLPPVDRV